MPNKKVGNVKLSPKQEYQTALCQCTRKHTRNQKQCDLKSITPHRQRLYQNSKLQNYQIQLSKRLISDDRTTAEHQSTNPTSTQPKPRFNDKQQNIHKSFIFTVPQSSSQHQQHLSRKLTSNNIKPSTPTQKKIKNLTRNDIPTSPK